MEDAADDPESAGDEGDEGTESVEEIDHSLLPQLNGKVLVVKDFTLIHDKPAEARAQILSILRDVYDGFSSRKFGNSETKSYHSRFNLLAGMTPDIEKSWSLNTLGERFLMYRLKIEDRREHARKALDAVRKSNVGVDGPRVELQRAVKHFLDNLTVFEPEVDDSMFAKIIDLAEIVSTCRTYVYRDRNDDMPCLPQAEMAARVAKQLMRVGMPSHARDGWLSAARSVTVLWSITFSCSSRWLVAVAQRLK